MSLFQKLCSVFILIFLSSCFAIEEEIEVTVHSCFDTPFPKRTINLTWKLGSEFSLKSAGDTLNYSVSFDRKTNFNTLVLLPQNDTVFNGLVSKYRGLYYFSKPMDDLSYWIYAVEITNTTIKGLNTEWDQMNLWDDRFDYLLIDSSQINDQKSPVFKSVDPHQKKIHLTPDKKTMSEVYSFKLSEFSADTILKISFPELNLDSVSSATLSENKAAQKNKLIDAAHPNPANDFLTIDFTDEQTGIWMIFDLSGKLLLTGSYSANQLELPVSELSNGSYFLQLYEENLSQTESVTFQVQH